MPWLLAPIKFAQYTDVARLYLIVLFIGGLGRHLQDTALGPLLQQGRAQISIVTRNITFPLFLGVAAVQGEVHLNQLVLAELAASVLSTSVAVLGLIRHLRSRHDFPGRVGWNPPTWSEMWCVGRQMYVTELVALAYSRQVLIFMTQRFLGVETTALFGFLLNLYGQVARYLPANLLFGLIRPKLVASYVDKGCMAELTRNANLVGKLNLFVLVPLLIFAWLAGNELVSILSGGKFIHSGNILAGLLLALIPLSQLQILVTVAVVSDKSQLVTWGSVFGLLALPLAFWLLELGWGLWSPVIAMIVGQVLFNTILIGALEYTTTYRPDTIGFFKLLASALLVFTLGFLVKMAWAGAFHPDLNGSVGFLQNIQSIVSMILTQQIAVPGDGYIGLAIMAALALGLFLLVSYCFKPFLVEERTRLNRLLNRNIFVW